MNEQLDQTDAKEAAKAASPRQITRRTPGARPAQPQAPRVQVEDEEDSFFAKHGIKIIIGGVIVLAAGAAYFHKPGSPTPQRAPERMVSIQLPPPPPPPPPPKKVPPPPPKEEKMVEQTPVAEQEKPVEAPKPPDAAPAPLGTGLKGDGPGMAGLGGSGNGGGVFGGGGSGGGGSKWGFYAGQVQSHVAQALRGNKTTKSADLKVQVRIWVDSITGRVTRAKLDGSTGDRSLDTALQNEVLTGLQLSGPPPQGMPMPIVMRVTGHRP